MDLLWYTNISLLEWLSTVNFFKSENLLGLNPLSSPEMCLWLYYLMDFYSWRRFPVPDYHIRLSPSIILSISSTTYSNFPSIFLLFLASFKTLIIYKRVNNGRSFIFISLFSIIIFILSEMLISILGLDVCPLCCPVLSLSVARHNADHTFRAARPCV